MNWLARPLSPPPLPPKPPRLFQFGGSRGIVAQHASAWKSHTVSGGGDGYLRNGTGHINPVWSRTEHMHWQEFWVRTDDGQESPYWLQGYETVKLRQGHEVGVLLVNGTVTYLLNYQMDTIYRITPLDGLLPLRRSMHGCLMAILVLCGAPMLGFLVWLLQVFVVLAVTGQISGPQSPGRSPTWLDAAEGQLGWMSIVGAMLVTVCWLVRRARRNGAFNEALRRQGRAELDAGCLRFLGVKPTV